MSALAPTLEAYFTERLIDQRRASPNTVAAYRDAWRMLLRFAQAQTEKEPSQLDIADLDASLVVAFLNHLENERHNSPRTRNARLAAIRSFFRYASFRHPEHGGLIARVLDIPTKRTDRKDVTWSKTRSRPCWRHPIVRPGAGAETTPSSRSRSRPACGSRS
jgi:integrase/recombinase XerD